MDGLSDDEEVRSIRSSVHQAPDTTEVAGPAQESEITPVKDPEHHFACPEPEDVTSGVEKAKKDEPHHGTAAAVADDAQPEIDIKEDVDDILPSFTTSADPKPDVVPTSLPEAKKAEKQTKPDSIVSAIDSKPSSITKDRLPPQMSRVVMSYRTNEWAKHLSMADAPEVEELKLAGYPAEDQATAMSEMPVPVKVEELQQTAESATPAPAPSRSASQLSNHLSAVTRSNSALSKHAVAPALERSDSAASAYPQDSLNPSLSQQSLASLKSVSNPVVARGFRSVSSPNIPQPIVESPTEAEYSSHSPNVPSTSKFSSPNVPYGAPSTLIGKRDSMLRQKYNPPPNLASTPEVPFRLPNGAPIPQPSSYIQYPSGPASVRAESDAGSIYNYPNTNAIMYDNDEGENMSLSARREMIRQSSLNIHQNPSSSSLIAPTPLQTTPVPFDSHQPRRQPSGPSPMAREQQLASWRASIQYELQSSGMPQNTIERQRSQLWQERQQDEQRKALEEKRRGERDSAFDERMRRGDMLDAHREALRKMQAAANKHA